MKRRGVWKYLIVGILLLSACKPKVPEQYIQPDDMEELLYDYYVGQGISNTRNENNNSYKRQLIYNAVLKKHGVTREEFDSSLVYYYTRADRFIKIFDNVQKRLADEALALGASNSEVERFTQSLSGDTANVWEGPLCAVLMPKAPYNAYQFVQKADSTFRVGDNFMMTMKGNFLVQSGPKSAMAYLSVIYENDSVISQHITLSLTGVTQLRIPVCNQKAKEFRGMIYMNKRPDSDHANEMSILFVDQISLIRFHRPKDAPPLKDATTDSASVKSKPDSVVPPIRRRLGERPQMMSAPNRKNDIKPITR